MNTEQILVSNPSPTISIFTLIGLCLVVCKVLEEGSKAFFLTTLGFLTLTLSLVIAYFP